MRTLSEELLDLIASGRYGRRRMLRVDLGSGNHGFWDDVYDVTYNDVVYHAIPGALHIPKIDMTADLSIRDVQVVIAPMVPIVTSQLTNEVYIRRPAYIHEAYINLSTAAVVGIVDVFSGRINGAEYKKHKGNTAGIYLTLSSSNWDLNASGARIRNSSDQHQIVSDDTGFDFTSSSVSTPIWWGRDGPQRPTSS